MNIYVVMGTTGEYSDRREWPVRAFREKADAEALIVKATQRANEIFAKLDAAGESYQPWSEDRDRNEFDPDMKMDYVGASYFYYQVLLEG